MKIVIDASLALKWVLPEPDSAKALLLRDDHRNAIHELIAPDILLLEVANALTKAERRKIINPPEASQKFLDVAQTKVNLLPHIAVLARALELASNARIAIYDCVYVALAEKENCDLVTADAKLITNLQKQFPFIKDLAAMP